MAEELLEDLSATYRVYQGQVLRNWKGSCGRKSRESPPYHHLNSREMGVSGPLASSSWQVQGVKVPSYYCITIN